MNQSNMSLFGLPIYLDSEMDTVIPARVHRPRRGQTANYHRRIQKKWLKRYGYMIDEKIMEYTSPLTGVRMLAMSPRAWAAFQADKALMERQRIPEPQLLLDPSIERRKP